MDEEMKKIIKDVFSAKIESGELNEMNDKELKTIISDILTEKLISQFKKRS